MGFVRNLFCAFLWVSIAVLCSCESSVAEQFVVKDGEPNAEIVVNKDAPRMARFAALELQYYLKKMSGVQVPIVFEKTDDENIKIYVGKSKYTDEMGIDDKGLKYGAFRMDVGEDYLVLLGHDFDYMPPKPLPIRNNDIKRAEEEWKKSIADKTDAAWKLPWQLNYKNWNQKCDNEFVANRYGKENLKVWNPSGKEWNRGLDYFENYKNGFAPGFWLQDEGGSLNAVYSFLRNLGARWYMPNEVGEVIPEVTTIALPEKSKVEKPDFAVRYWLWYNYAMYPFENIMWARRLGMNSGYEMFGNMADPHGLTMVHGTKEMQEKHPDYYALGTDGKKRATEYRGLGHVCFSSEGLFKETLKFARFMFDEYNEPHISLWPCDGFYHCQCENCKKLSSSDLVWGFVDRVARELYKTHPDRIVTCGAYTSYIHPPKNVEKFSPNVIVLIANCGRAMMDDPEHWNTYWNRIEVWRKKVAPGNIMRYENNRYGLERKFPVIHVRNMAKDLKALKGISQGESCEESVSKGRFHSPGFDHLTLYVQGRLLWNADLDVETLIAEYYETFYGPVAKETREALEFAQGNYSRSNVNIKNRATPNLVSLPVRIKFAEMLNAAYEKSSDTIYGKRIQVIIDECEPLDALQKELAEKKELGNPREKTPVVVVGHINDPVKPETHTFIPMYGYIYRDVVPNIPTKFSVAWEAKTLIFNIFCQEPDMKNLNVADDVWDGDSVVIVLESPSHSFYQLEINPDGKLYDADRSGGGRVIPRWKSMADVKTEKGDDFWRAAVRIPIAVIGEEGAEGDPMNYVVGPKLEDGGEWWFNIARRRKRTDAKGGYRFNDITAVFSKSAPLHLRKFLDPHYFGKLEIKKKPVAALKDG